MGTPKQKYQHTHRFVKVNGKRIKFWRCSLDGCRFLVYHATEEILLGRNSVCWDCGREFSMTDKNLTEEFPICVLCRSKDGLSATDINRMIREKTELNKR